MHKNQIVCLILLLYFSQIEAITIGSDTAVSLLTDQTSLNNGDIVAGFAYLDGGFLITSNSVTATWNSSFPVSNLLDFNGGALYLSTDLQVSGSAMLNSLGTIIGNNHAFEFSPTMTAFVSCGLTELTNTSLAFTTTQTGWSFNESFASVSGPSTFVNYPFNGTSLGAAASSALTNSNLGAFVWHPLNYFVAINTGGAINTTTVFSVNPVSGALTTVSSVVVGGLPFSYSWHPSQYYIAATGSTFVQLVPVTAAGVLGTPINATGSFAGVIARTCDWSPTGTYLAVGYGVVAGNVQLFALGGTPASPTLSLVTQASLAPSGNGVINLEYNPVYPEVFALITQGPLAYVLLYAYNASSNTLSQIAAARIANNGARSVSWSADGTCLVAGTGLTLEVYSFDYMNSLLTYCCSYPFTQTYAEYSPINSYLAVARVTPNALTILKPNEKRGICSNLYITLANDIIMQNCFLKFQGNCTIFGNGHSIDLYPTATLAIDAYASLTLKNTTVRSLQDGSIRMVHPSSRLVLDNSTLLLDSDFTFTQGILQICNDVAISGEGLYFMYTSTSVSTIAAYSSLFLDNALTFSYAPRIGANNLLQFTDNTSQLVLNGATLSATTTGMALLGGTMVVEGHAYLASTATNTTQAILFGSGSSSCQNMQLHIAPAAVLELTSGIVVNNNL